MSTSKGPEHVVVDGSNIATEGRSMPSLAQLSEAVAGFMDEHPETAVTVVVDATFGHRIDKKEVKEFEAGISNNELVAPPAGAVGRGDAFVLGIADKARASVLSNDSFQEFHGEYTWLFDEGRLIGGKPVPHVGWVWVHRVPVRGPISRKATRGSGGSGGTSRRTSGGRSRRGSGRENGVRTGSPEASGPMPRPKSPPPRRAADDTDTDTAIDTGATSEQQPDPSAARPAPKGSEAVNELMPFLDFVEKHPAGTSVNGTVDAYSSHGAYVSIADTGVRGYIPLRLMADPAPRSAKKIMKIGESVTVVVVSFAAARRSIDCALPAMADDAIAEAAADETDTPVPESIDAESESSPRPGKKSAPKKKSAAKKKTTTRKQATTKTTAKKPTTRKPITEEPTTEKPTIQKAAAKKATGKKAAAKKPTAKKTTAKKTTAKKTTAKKTTAKKAAVTKTAAKKATAEKTTTEKTTTKTAAAKKKPAQKRSTQKKAVTKKTAESSDD